MSLKKQVKTLLITISSFFVLGFSSCESIPEHNPSLLQLNKNRVLKHNLIDKNKIIYKADSFQPIESVDGGYCFPPGQFEKVIDYIRNNQCEKALQEIEAQ